MSTLVVLALWAISPQMEQELARQGRQIEALETRFEAQERETAALRSALEQQVPCQAELVATDAGAVDVSGDSAAIVRFSLLATVSRPERRCLPASVWVTASYMDGDGAVVCTGSVEDLASLEILAGNVSVEVAPWDLVNFARWANQPPRTETGFVRIRCMTPDGLVEVRTLPDTVASLILRVSLFPANGGLASSDFRVRLR
jgi:hypothetical protein